MKKDVILWTGAGQIGMAIARRVGAGKNCGRRQTAGKCGRHRQDYD